MVMDVVWAIWVTKPRKIPRAAKQRCPWYQGDDTKGQLEALLASKRRLDSMTSVNRAVGAANPEERKGLDSMTGVNRVVRAASLKEKKDSLSLLEEASKWLELCE